MQSPRGEPAHRTLALLLAALSVALLGVTAPDIGLTWDEPAYIAASESYVAWLEVLVTHPGEAFDRSQIDHFWAINQEHPPLDKLWSGLVWVVARHAFDDLTAHRLGNLLLVGGLVAMLYSMVAQSYGRAAGLGAAAALLSMPRFFFHAHLAALDVPAAVAVFAVVYLFWLTRDRQGLRFGVGLGLAWGLALATKINAVFIVPVLLLWVALAQRQLHLLLRIGLLGLIGPPVAVAVWPWMYHDTVARLSAYGGFVSVGHWGIGQWYLGAFTMPPPWHFPFVMTLAVVPLALTILCVLGVVRVVRDGVGPSPGWLFVIGACIPLLALCTGKSMVYDNERLFMPAFPCLAALAGIGFARVVRRARAWVQQLGRPALATPATLLVAALAFLPHLVLARDLYPHWLSYYSETIGGLSGATRLQLETTYWCDTYAEALPFLNAQAEHGAVVWVEDWTHDVMFYYQLHGRLRPDLQIRWPPGSFSVFERQGMRGRQVPFWNADYVVLQYRQTGFYAALRAWLAGRQPAFRLHYRGIPLLDVYARTPRPASPEP